jgi:AcrR family transcriptional regulator
VTGGEPERLLATRDRILVEASRLFAAKGYAGTSTREIARAVGIRQPSLFHHFAGKGAILDELLRLAIDEAAQRASRLAAEPGPAAPRLFAYLYWDAVYLLSSAVDLTGVHGADVFETPEFGRWAPVYALWRGSLASLVEQGVESGEFEPADPVLTVAILAAITRASMRVHDERRAGDPAELARQSASFALRGLLREPGALDALPARGEVPDAALL